MNTFRYVMTAPTGKEQLPFTPFVHLQLNIWSQNNGNDHLLTAQLINDTEIDWWVDALKRDLDRAGRLAKGALRRAKEKQKTAMRT